MQGVVLAHDDALLRDGEKMAEYLRNLKSQEPVSKAIYKNELRSGNFSSTAGLIHLENRYNKEHLYLVDSKYAINVAAGSDSQ